MLVSGVELCCALNTNIAVNGFRHAQSDDTQLYIPLTDNSSSCTLDLCFSALHSWFCANGLSLNPDKSEAIILGNRPPHLACLLAVVRRVRR